MARGGRKKAPIKIPGQEYGAQAEQVRSQQAVPVAPPPSAAPVQTSLETLLAGAPRPSDAPTLLDGESERPHEPITAGLPSGPGPGPEALMTPGVFLNRRPGTDELEALFAVFPFEGIRRILANQR